MTPDTPRYLADFLQPLRLRDLFHPLLFKIPSVFDHQRQRPACRRTSAFSPPTEESGAVGLRFMLVHPSSLPKKIKFPVLEVFSSFALTSSILVGRT